MKWVALAYRPHDEATARGKRNGRRQACFGLTKWPRPEAATSSQVQCTYDQPPLLFVFSSQRTVALLLKLHHPVHGRKTEYFSLSSCFFLDWIPGADQLHLQSINVGVVTLNRTLASL